MHHEIVSTENICLYPCIYIAISDSRENIFMLVSLYLSIVSLKVLVPRFSILRNIPRWFRSVPRFSMSPINRVSGQGRCPDRLCHGVSGQGRCPGRQLGLGFVLAFRVEKQNIGSSRNRNPVGAVYS